MGALMKQMRGRKFGTIKEFLRNLGPMMRAAYSDGGIDPDTHWCRIVVAFYSHEHGGAHGCSIFTSRHAGPDELKPFTVYPTRKVIMPQVDEVAAYGGEVDMLSQAFDPARHSMPLIEAQRRPSSNWSHQTGEHCYVAGDIILTTVSARGIEAAKLHSYPDMVGQRAGTPSVLSL